MTLCDRSPFDNCKILTEIVVTSHVAKSQWQITKLVAALSNKARSVLIKKRRTVKVIIGGLTAKGSISVLRTAGRQRRIKGRFVRAVNRHAWYEAELEVAATERGRRRKVVKDNRRAALVPVHCYDLPTAKHFAGWSMTEVFLPGPGGEFIEVANYNGTRGVFITQALFSFQVKWGRLP